MLDYCSSPRRGWLDNRADPARTSPLCRDESELLSLCFVPEGVDADVEEETLLGTFMYNVAKEAIQTFPLKVRSAHGGKMPGSTTGLPASPWQEELNAFSLGTGARTTAERDLAGVGKGGVACGGGSKRIARAGSRPWEHES